MSGVVLSLFPGIGLLDMAFEEEGFCVVRGPDLLWGGDVRRFDPPAGRFDGVIGGPPCQSWSKMGNTNKARWGDDCVMPDMIPEFRRCVEAAKPRWFIMENVPDAPLPGAFGYAEHDEVVCDDWFGGVTARPRRITFGTGDMYAIGRWKRTLHRQQKLAPPNPEPVILSTGQRGAGGPRASINAMARSQGIDPTRFEHSPFSVTELRRAISNGVPLPMGLAVARAVKAALAPYLPESAP